MSETAANELNNSLQPNKSQNNPLRPKESPVTSSPEMVEETKELKDNNGNSSQNVREDFVSTFLNSYSMTLG